MAFDQRVADLMREVEAARAEGKAEGIATALANVRAAWEGKSPRDFDSWLLAVTSAPATDDAPTAEEVAAHFEARGFVSTAQTIRNFVRDHASPRAAAPASVSRTTDAPLVRLTEAEGAPTPTED